MLYHYTDAAGLVGMLKYHSIWASDYRFLNDKSEVQHTRALARDLILAQSQACKDQTRDKLYRSILHYQSMDSTADEFVFSLSTRADDLSQWRGYAREGRGFTLGFSGSALRKANVWFARVIYNDGPKKKSLLSALRDLEIELERQIMMNHHRKDEIIDSAGNWFDYLIENCAVFNKHRSFQSEREWRLVTNVSQEDAAGLVKVRANGDRLVRYIELRLGEKLPLKEIGIGPGFIGTEEIYAVKSLCAEHGYQPKIYSADTPYRRL